MKLQGTIIKMLSEKAGVDVTSKAGAEFLRNDIEARTGEALSLNTMKRLVGLLPYDSSPREITQDIIARYLGFGNGRMLQEFIDNKISDFKTPEGFIDLKALPKDTGLIICWNPNRRIHLKHSGEGVYEVKEAENSKLLKGDILVLSQVAEGFPFMVSDVRRAGHSLGNYTAAQTEGVSSVEVDE